MAAGANTGRRSTETVGSAGGFGGTVPRMQFRVLRHGVVDSTSERAFAAIEDGSARHGDVHVAEAQTRGRGRLGRSWASAPGEGLYLSTVLLPGPPPLSPTALTMATGLAVHDAVRGLGVDAVRLDWPNDVVVDDAKLCGILVESRGLTPAAPHCTLPLLLTRSCTKPAS